MPTYRDLVITANLPALLVAEDPLDGRQILVTKDLVSGIPTAVIAGPKVPTELLPTNIPYISTVLSGGVYVRSFAGPVGPTNYQVTLSGEHDTITGTILTAPIP